MSVSAPIPFGVTADDLAPADLRSAEFDWTGFTVSFIDTPDHPRFSCGYAALWQEFSPVNEMEQRSVIEQRMCWRPESPIANHALLYEMVVITHGDELAAVRDHTAIVDLQHPEEPVIVHLSHILVMPAFRGGGLTGWLRAMPIRTARECLARAGQSSRSINLVAEMEPSDPSKPDRMHRLSAYQKVGFVKVDPRVVHYLQPDFRTPADIDATGGPKPIPLSLVVRRVKRESDTTVSANEVRTMVESLYTMYGQTFRESDMAPNWESLRQYPTGDFPIELVPPIRPG